MLFTSSENAATEFHTSISYIICKKKPIHFKGYARYIFAILFLMSKKGVLFKLGKNTFYFTSKTFFAEIFRF